ncbi:MAG: hypothetical protein KBS52_00115 [Clostridiales bacterium]|nr:hypothetical protein [Candidatus Equinaster intestinalis]
MIEVLPLKNNEEIKAFFEENAIEYNQFAGVTVARFGEEQLGFCAYYLDKEKITVIKIEPQNDLMLLDGILRSALHIADFRNIEKAYYTDEQYTSVFKKLDFVKNEAEKSLKIEKLHESCCHCEKNDN